ncbi:hypothetical protein FOJ82_13260 [Tessaracoccus rhinocerotis]|uniref:Uncharacterized protein n=1 Tax=Tessaracoccus rhinocerotis TaxID=1689449 RepID=A0A553JYF6_9ACTN|nr:hypothetical protein [Tessaracoccus rhinocerotis]TRY17486.1 hypothetical protein FOJ82_13260 [Tessaracoccus rhinocerotis]
MTETHDRETPDLVNADEIRALDAVWRRFEAALIKHLADMVRDRGRNTLVLELAGPALGRGTARRYLELATDGDDRLLHATAGGNAHAALAGLRRRGWYVGEETGTRWTTERPIGELAELAADAVWALRHCHRVAHPDLLTYRGDGHAVPGASRLGLLATDDVPVEARASIRFAQATEPDDGPPMPIVTTSTQDLMSLVEAAVGHGADIHVDFALYVQRQPVFVRVSDDQTSVRLSARVVRDVSSPSEARTDIRIFNRDGWLDWHVARRDIWVSGTIPTDPFDQPAFRESLQQFLEILLTHRHALARRTGGRTY